MDVICLQEVAFYKLVDTVVKYVKETNQVKEAEWVSLEEAMEILRVKSKATMQRLRDERKIEFSQPEKKYILYKRTSLLAYLEKHVIKPL